MQCKTMQVLNSVRETIRRHHMFKEGDSVLVGVSGGADSVCLLHILKTLVKEFNLQLSVAHVHHGIRGVEADRDAEFVKNLCGDWGIPVFLDKVSAKDLSREEKVSLETAGRLARYRYFHEICNKKKISKIATAHNQNDQAETVLMRVLRGAGMDGLAGIRYTRADGVIRPLLDISRKDIEAYCQENQLEYCVDNTNQENDYTRNRIRNQLLPLLEEEFNPNILTALSKLGQNMAEDGTFLDGYAKRLYRRINGPIAKRRPVVLDIESMQMIEPSIRTRLFRIAAEDAMGNGYQAERNHWESVTELLDKETGAMAVLPHGLTVSVRYGWIAFETPLDRKKTDESMTVYAVEPGGVYDLETGTVSLEIQEKPEKVSKNQMILDFDKISGQSLVLRTRRSGDRIALFKDGKEKKLKDFFIDCKIPQQERDGIWLLCSENHVIAVLGYRIAEPYKADKNTERGLVITYEKKDESRQNFAD